MANAGRVAIVPKGEYSATVAYKRLDLVRYNNDLYIAKKANTGVAPTDSETWMLSLENVSQTQYDNLINGTTPAGDSNLLQGYTAEEVGESGVRNLIPYPYYETTKTVNGITFTDNGDGTVTANGTATASSPFYLTSFTESTLLKLDSTKTYTVSMSNASGNTQLAIRLYKDGDELTTSGGTLVTVTASGKYTFTGYSYIGAYLRIVNGATVNNITFEPMLEIGSVAHPWRHYHLGGAEHALKADNANTVDGLHAYEFMPYHAENDRPYSTAIGRLEWNSAKGAFEWRVRQNGALQKVDADTVDGYHASDFARSIDFYRAHDFAGMESGNTNELYRLQLQNGVVQVYKSTDSGVTWSVKGVVATTADLANYLPLTGGTLSGNNLFIANGYGDQYADHNSIQIASKNTPNGNTGRFLEIKNSNYDSNVNTALLFRDMVNGVITDYDILHTGNSAKVIVSNTAPTDTTAMWYDTANKAWKRYVAEYGAWQA